jgi:hypothetical protein
MGFGSTGIVLDTEASPSEAIKYSGPHNTAENVAEGWNRGHDAIHSHRVNEFERAYRNVATRE